MLLTMVVMVVASRWTSIYTCSCSSPELPYICVHLLCTKSVPSCGDHIPDMLMDIANDIAGHAMPDLWN